MRLLTWNIQWARGVDGRVDLRRIVDEALRWADPDVLLLQELADGFAEPALAGHDGSDQFADLATLLPGWTVLAGPATDLPGPTGRRQRFGNAIASRRPVGAVIRHSLPWPADPSVKSMQRGALEATVATGFGPVRVISTHLEYHSAVQRAAQVERLRALQREGWRQAVTGRPGGATDGPFDAVARGGPCVLGGDLNAKADAAERRRLLEAFDDGTPPWRDAWSLAHPGAAPPWTVGVHDRVQWAEGPMSFDALLVSDDQAARVRRCEVDLRSRASDHQPVMVELLDDPGG